MSQHIWTPHKTVFNVKREVLETITCIKSKMKLRVYLIEPITYLWLKLDTENCLLNFIKVFWEGHKIWKSWEISLKICGLLGIYQLSKPPKWPLQTPLSLKDPQISPIKQQKYPSPTYKQTTQAFQQSFYLTLKLFY